MSRGVCIMPLTRACATVLRRSSKRKLLRKSSYIPLFRELAMSSRPPGIRMGRIISTKLLRRASLAKNTMKKETPMSVDPLRHLSVFKPHAFGTRRVDVIGCGATGSRIVLSLAKLGVENIHAWDFDTVEDHNLANQAFGLGDVGLLKVDALASLVQRGIGVAIQTHAEKVDGSQSLGEVVFLLTDTMASRKEIWDRGLKLKLQT